MGGIIVFAIILMVFIPMVKVWIEEYGERKERNKRIKNNEGSYTDHAQNRNDETVGYLIIVLFLILASLVIILLGG